MLSNTQLQWYCHINDYDAIIRDNWFIIIRKPLTLFPHLYIDIRVEYVIDSDGNKSGITGILMLNNEVLYSTTQLRLDANDYPWKQVFHDLFQQLNIFTSTLTDLRKSSDLTV